MSLKKENFVLGKYGLKASVINIESLKISLFSNLAVKNSKTNKLIHRYFSTPTQVHLNINHRPSTDGFIVPR